MSLALSKIDLTDAAAVWRRNSRVYLRLWKTELIAPVIEPIFTFFAFGFGVGALVTSNVSGGSYLSFVGAGVLAFTVLQNGSVQLAGIGKLKLGQRAERQGRNPATGEAITIKASKTVKFSGGKRFKDSFR